MGLWESEVGGAIEAGTVKSQLHRPLAEASDDVLKEESPCVHFKVSALERAEGLG